MRILRNLFRQKNKYDLYLWSIAFIYKGELKYELMGNNVNYMLGYFMPSFSESNLANNWKLKLLNNVSRKEIILEKRHFHDMYTLSDELEDFISQAENIVFTETWIKEVKFFDRITNEEINVETFKEINLSSNIDEMFNQFVNNGGIIQNGVSFFSILDNVFGEKNET